jgi:hypothetical protein
MSFEAAPYRLPRSLLIHADDEFTLVGGAMRGVDPMRVGIGGTTL